MPTYFCTLCAFEGGHAEATHIGYSNTDTKYYLCKYHALDGTVNLHNRRELTIEEIHNIDHGINPTMWTEKKRYYSKRKR